MSTIKQRLLDAIDRSPIAKLENTLIFLENRLTLNPQSQNTIALRQQCKMSLGDATIATHNIADFRWVPNLVVIDPINKN